MPRARQTRLRRLFLRKLKGSGHTGLLHTSGPEATPSSLNSQGQRLRHREHPPSPVLPPVMTCFASLLNWAVLGKAVRDQREAERLRDHPPTWNLTIECLLQTLRKLPVRARTGDYLICCKTARPSDGAKSLSSPSSLSSLHKSERTGSHWCLDQVDLGEAWEKQRWAPCTLLPALPACLW